MTTVALKLTPNDRAALEALPADGSEITSSAVGRLAGYTTRWPAETASLHCHKLLDLGLIDKTGKRQSPTWRINEAGLAHRTS